MKYILYDEDLGYFTNIPSKYWSQSKDLAYVFNSKDDAKFLASIYGGEIQEI